MILMQEFVFQKTVKKLNVKVFNLMSRTNETRSIEWHETRKCICRLNEIIRNNKQRWNKDKCRCEGFIFNPSNCECECDKYCNTGQYLDYPDCKCKKKLIDPFIEECTGNDDDDKTKIVNTTVENKNSSCKMYVIFMTIAFTILTGITIYFVYYNWFLIKNKVFCTKSNTHKETLIWRQNI